MTIKDAEFLRGTALALSVLAQHAKLSDSARADLHDAAARLDRILARESIDALPRAPRQVELAL